jgi:hypothetical protein
MALKKLSPSDVRLGTSSFVGPSDQSQLTVIHFEVACLVSIPSADVLYQAGGN